MTADRAWVVEMSYSGKTPFWFGTVFAPVAAKEMEVERLAIAAAGEHLPAGFHVAKLMPGMLIFRGEGE